MWGPIITFIASLIGPLLGYVIKALGIGLISYVGLTLVFDQLESLVMSYYQGLPTTMLQVANLAGFGSAIKIILSTAVACAGYRAMIHSTGLVWKKPGSAPVKTF